MSRGGWTIGANSSTRRSIAIRASSRRCSTVSLTLTYDESTDIAYLTIQSTGPSDLLGPTLDVEAAPDFAGSVRMDFTFADGKVAGFEFHQASACLPAELLARADRASTASQPNRPQVVMLASSGRYVIEDAKKWLPRRKPVTH